MVDYEKYQTKSGITKWQYYEFLGLDDKTGQQKRLRKRGFNTRAEAKVAFERALTQYHKENSYTQAKKMKFKDVYDKYLPFYRNTGVTGGTIKKFRDEVNNHIMPVLGNYYIERITVSDCQEMVEFIKGRRKDYRKIIGHCRSIFRFAVQEGFVNESPIDKVIITKSKKKYVSKRVSTDTNVYTTEQLLKLLAFLEHHGEFHHFVYFRLLAFTGLRRGEALALKKSDINHVEKAITVSRTLAENESGGTLVSEYTKTGNAEEGAKTVLYLDDVTYDAIKALCKKTVFLSSNHKYVEILDATYIFVSPRTGSHYHRSAPNEWLRHIWNKYSDEFKNLELHYVSPHGFRHSQASMLFELGVDPKDAQHRLRHRNAKTTMDIYTHLSEKRKKSTVDLLNSIESPVPTSVPTFEIMKKTKN